MVYVPMDDQSYYRASLDLGLSNTPEVLRDLKDTFGEDCVKVGFSTEIVFRPREPRYPSRGNRPRK